MIDKVVILGNGDKDKPKKDMFILAVINAAHIVYAEPEFRDDGIGISFFTTNGDFHVFPKNAVRFHGQGFRPKSIYNDGSPAAIEKILQAFSSL